MAAEQPVMEQTPQPAPSGGKMSQEDIEKLLAGASAPAPAPEPKTTLPPTPTPPPAPADEEEDVSYTNIMEVLVEEKAEKYVKMFGLCSCERCMEDVKAYTLNHLPSKYVVLEQGDLIPRLTVYEGKLSSDITAQLLQACKVVMERPHHGR